MSRQHDDERSRGRISSEHHSLDALFGETRAAFGSAGTRGRARLALSHLLEEVESHLFREEALYYPTIWALRPDYMGPLRLLVDSHAHLRRLLDAIGACVERAADEDAARGFDEFTRLFRDHERAEEKLLETLEDELGTAR